jgi:hypothetical protein
MLLCFSASALKAQQTMASAHSAASGDTVVPVTLGQSVVALNGPWRFHVGDDPRWAAPDFDDSTWEQYVLAPGIQSLTPERVVGMGDLPGWQGHGHPGHAGYGWYRIQLMIGSDAMPVALLMPAAVQNSYEVYLNGRLISKLGRLDGFQLSYLPRPEFIPIPADAARIGQPNTLAIRFWSEPWQANPRRPEIFGGLRALPLFGSSELVRVFSKSVPQRHTEEWGQGGPWLLLLVWDGAVGLISIFLFLLSRTRREYLWAGVALCSYSLVWVSNEALEFRHPAQLTYPLGAIGLWLGVFSIPLAAMYLLGVPRAHWKRGNYFVSSLNAVWTLVSGGVVLGFLPASSAFERTDYVLKWVPSALGVLLVLIGIDGIRTLGRKAWLLMTPGLFFGAQQVCFVFNDPDFVKLSPRVQDRLTTAGDYFSFCVAPAVLIILLLRFAQQQRENGRLVEDMRQAREVQQLTIPEKLPEISWLEIESEYLPAQEVGGDFFQIIPVEAEGVVIVAGDVTGHGLKAGMLVSLIVGAITTEVTHSADPLSLLHSLNERLCARGDSQATCLVVRIFSNGTATIANAGHLPPYLNGSELPIEGSLPLGMIATPSFSTLEFDLNESDQLLLISDGVVEAKHEGQLFGFDRIQQLLASRTSARQLASAAAKFGQEDDITVLLVTRTKSRQETFAFSGP